MKWSLQTEEGHVEHVATAGLLRERLLQLHDQAKHDPLFAVLNSPDGSSLAIGLGREWSVLSYTATGGWPARHVHGNDINEGLLNYKFFGHFSEMPARYAVVFSDALDAAVSFFESGRLSEKLQWEDD
jgi:hypothetical protein